MIQAHDDSLDKETIMNLRRTACALLLSMPCLSATAQQPATASASLRDFQYTLVDLAPQDGIAPWIRIEEPWYWPTTTIFSERGWSGEVLADTQGGELGGPVRAAFGRNVASGRLSETAADSYIEIHDGSGLSYNSYHFSFVVSPNTRLVFSAYGMVEASMEDGVNYAGGSAGWDGGLTVAPGADEIDLWTIRGVFATGRDEGPLSVSVDTGALEGTGWMSFGANVAASILPVPEPSRWTMLLAGVMLTASLARRRLTGAGR